MGKKISLEARDLKEAPEFWVTFTDADAEERNVDVRGQSFALKLRYLSDAEYQRKVQKKAEMKEKGMSQKLTATASLAQLADLQAKEVILDWRMPADRFHLSVPITAERVAELTGGQGFQPDDEIEFSQDACARFIKSEWGYAGFISDKSRAAYEANAKAEEGAAGNSPGASETD